MQLIQEYFPKLNPRQTECLIRMGALYTYWNVRINLISRKTAENFYKQHVLHALGIAKVINFLPGACIMDVGTGGGFPGIPLAILFPESQFLLIDSIVKKIKAVKAITKELDLNNVQLQCIRVEAVEEKFDFILSRAVTQIPQLYNWVKDKFRTKSQHVLPNGILSLKGGELSEELKNFPQAVEFPLTDYFKIAFFEGKKVVYIPKNHTIHNIRI
ncbi:MAG: 16S rRNA (guanine(527)-N(7))-methyltransferase RsmG [Flavobacteriales bacterium]